MNKRIWVCLAYPLKAGFWFPKRKIAFELFLGKIVKELLAFGSSFKKSQCHMTSLETASKKNIYIYIYIQKFNFGFFMKVYIFKFNFSLIND